MDSENNKTNWVMLPKDEFDNMNKKIQILNAEKRKQEEKMKESIKVFETINVNLKNIKDADAIIKDNLTDLVDLLDDLNEKAEEVFIDKDGQRYYKNEDGEFIVLANKK